MFGSRCESMGFVLPRSQLRFDRFGFYNIVSSLGLWTLREMCVCGREQGKEATDSIVLFAECYVLLANNRGLYPCPLPVTIEPIFRPLSEPLAFELIINGQVDQIHNTEHFKLEFSYHLSKTALKCFLMARYLN